VKTLVARTHEKVDGPWSLKSSFDKLDIMEKNSVIIRLEQRRYFWMLARAGELVARDSVLLVGDRPGPAAPKDPYYHHTPFYSTKHCSGWLNLQLEAEKITENKLVWVNSADEKGNDYDIKLVNNVKPKTIIALGGNAKRWLIKNGVKKFHEQYHPQYWKRFHNKERYPLLDLLKKLA